MPELPEVQTIVNDFKKYTKGERIVKFWSEWENGLKKPIKELVRIIAGSVIINAWRAGKHIVIALNNNHSIVIHLKMTGHLLFKEDNKKINKNFEDRVNQYIRHRFTFASGNVLEFSDLRKFGWIDVIPSSSVNELKSIKKLGVDAMKIKETGFRELVKNGKETKVGVFLLKQEVISGIGNIYRSEILFDSEIHPERRLSSLSKKEIESVFKSMRRILAKAIKLRGTSDSDYRDMSGKAGRFQEVLKVYRKEGDACVRCGELIKRMKIGQRSVFYCDYCQKSALQCRILKGG